MPAVPLLRLEYAAQGGPLSEVRPCVEDEGAPDFSGALRLLATALTGVMARPGDWLLHGLFAKETGAIQMLLPAVKPWMDLARVALLYGTVMSGDFIQRGQAAVYSKFARAEAAISCGVDLVLELPLPWTLSSAEGFARGAVGLLGATGVITHISFGSECGETEPLEQLAELLLDPLFVNDIKAELNNNEGISFAAARQRAAAKRVGELSCQLETPNNILAVEYIKQLYDQNLHIKPVTVQRFGSGHDQTGNFGPRSASEIRRAIASGGNPSASQRSSVARRSAS